MRTLLALGLAMSLAACAGRISNPIEVEQAGDFSLSCTAMTAEHQGNQDKYSFLENREAETNAQNISIGVLGFVFTPMAYIGLDLSDANQEEMAALEERRDRLEALMASRGCHVQDMAPAPYRAYVRETKVYTDEFGREISLPVNHFVYSTHGADRLAARDPAISGF